MTRFVCLLGMLVLVQTSPSRLLAESPEAELTRLRAEVAKLREENAALRKQLQDLGPLVSEFRGVLKEKSDSYYFPPPYVGTPGEGQNTWLEIDLGKQGGSHYLVFQGPEEYQEALSWKGNPVVVRGSVKKPAANPCPGMRPVPLVSGFAERAPSRRETLPLLVVDSLKPAEGAERAKDVQEKLQGTWRLVGLGADGVRLLEGHQQIRDAKLVIAGNKAVFTGNRVTLVGPAKQEKEKSFSFTLDLSTRPSVIQFTNDKETLRGIYQRDGDDLKLCFLRDGGAPVPTDFTANSASNRWLFSLKRDRPKTRRRQEMNGRSDTFAAGVRAVLSGGAGPRLQAREAHADGSPEYVASTPRECRCRRAGRRVRRLAVGGS